MCVLSLYIYLYPCTYTLLAAQEHNTRLGGLEPVGLCPVVSRWPQVQLPRCASTTAASTKSISLRCPLSRAGADRMMVPILPFGELFHIEVVRSGTRWDPMVNEPNSRSIGRIKPSSRTPRTFHVSLVTNDVSVDKGIYTYTLIYTPLPNSRWLHHTALRYVRRAQLGAYMWRKGLNSVKTGSKWAHFNCLCTPNGPGSLLEKRVFDPFFTQFCSQNGPFSRHFGIFHGPNRVTTSSKWAKNTCLSIPNGPGSLLKKRVFDPFLTYYWSQNGPFSRHFGIFHGPNRVTTSSKWAKNTCLSIPNGPGSLLEKRVFDPFLTHYWSQNGPFSRHVGIFHGPNRVTTGSKRAKNTCLSIPNGLRTTLEKIIFFAPGTVVDPPLAPTVRGPSCPAAPPSEH